MIRTPLEEVDPSLTPWINKGKLADGGDLYQFIPCVTISPQSVAHLETESILDG